MLEGNHRSPRRNAEVATGVVALLYGLVALGVGMFAPLRTVHVVYPGRSTTTLHVSLWEEFGPIFLWPFGQVALVICLLSLLAIGVGAITHGGRQLARGRLWLWSGTVVLGLEIAIGLTLSALVIPAELVPIFPMNYFALYLLPAVVLATFASGAATN